MSELGDKFKETIKNFCKENNINPWGTEMKNLVRAMDIDISTSETQDCPIDLEDEDHKALKELQEMFVQDCIHFINSREGLKKKIEQKKAELSEEWNRNLPKGLHIQPDISVYFGVDGLEESLIAEDWVPSTDSSLSICVGRIEIDASR